MTNNKYVEEGYSNAYVEEDNASPTIYAEDNYSKNYTKNNEDDYVENNNDVPLETSVNCDLSKILKKLEDISLQNIDLQKEVKFLKEDYDSLKNTTNNLLGVISKTYTTTTDTNEELKKSILTLKDEISVIKKQNETLVTTKYIDSKVPFVDDINIEVFKKGTIVVTSISGGFHTVESSSFLPDGQGGYSVVYTLAKEIDGVMQHSQFHSSYVKLGHPELLFRKSDYPDFFPDYKE